MATTQQTKPEAAAQPATAKKRTRKTAQSKFMQAHRAESELKRIDAVLVNAMKRCEQAREKRTKLLDGLDSEVRELLGVEGEQS